MRTRTEGIMLLGLPCPARKAGNPLKIEVGQGSWGGLAAGSFIITGILGSQRKCLGRLRKAAALPEGRN